MTLEISDYTEQWDPQMIGFRALAGFVFVFGAPSVSTFWSFWVVFLFCWGFLWSFWLSPLCFSVFWRPWFFQHNCCQGVANSHPLTKNMLKNCCFLDFRCARRVFSKILSSGSDLRILHNESRFSSLANWRRQGKSPRADRGRRASAASSKASN